MRAQVKLALCLGMTSALLTLTPAFGQPQIVTAGQILTDESFAPADHLIDTGEQVTYVFALRNIGTASTSNLVATLQVSGGVTAPGPAQTYGELSPQAAAVWRSFFFTAQRTADEPLIVTLQLRDGTNDLGTVSYPLPTYATTSFSNPSMLTIPSRGAAGLYPSPITVSNLMGTVRKIRVSLHRVTHEWANDIDALLVSPQGNRALVMSDVGGPYRVSSAELVFDDEASYALTSSPLASGVYLPSSFDGASDHFPAPAPGPAGQYYLTSFATFVDIDPNGTWNLYVQDDGDEDAGEITDGWTLTISCIGDEPPARLAVQRMEDRRVKLTLFGTDNRSYLIQYSTDMIHWIILGQLKPVGGTAVFFDGGAGAESRFYRARN